MVAKTVTDVATKLITPPIVSAQMSDVLQRELPRIMKKQGLVAKIQQNYLEGTRKYLENVP